MLQELPVIHFTFIFYLLGVIIGEVNVDRAYSVVNQKLDSYTYVSMAPTRSEISSPTFFQLSLSARISTTWRKSLLTTLETLTIYFHRKEININFYIPFPLAQLKPACNSLRHDLNGCYCGSVLLLSLILSLCTAC